jgi:hypothetical protein
MCSYGGYEQGRRVISVGDLAEDFAFMKKIKQKERAEKEPKRFEYATHVLIGAGHTVELYTKDNKCLIVNGYIKFWPYTGFFSGKGIQSGRGINNLVECLASEHPTPAGLPPILTNDKKEERI